MKLSSFILDALFPDACLGCISPRDASFRHDMACQACIRSVHLPEAFSCASCGTSSTSPRLTCHLDMPALLSLVPTQGRIVSVLTAGLLYEGLYRCAAPLGELCAATFVAAGMPLHRTYIAPIPETDLVIRERGYSAHLLLAEEIAHLLDIPLAAHLLSALRVNNLTMFGIDTPADAASAELIVLVGLGSLSVRTTRQLNMLVRSACPHADVVILTCST